MTAAPPLEATPPAPPPAPRRARLAFAFVFVTVALDMLALGVMIPVWPKLVLQMEGGDLERAVYMTGLSGLLWAAMQFVFSPVLGAVSDRIGRRPVILLSNFGLAADYVLMALAPTLGWLFVGRAISGITSASIPAASAYLTDVTPPERRAARFGLLGAAFGLGFVIGPAVGGILGSHDLRLPFWVSAGLSLANAAYGFFILPESLPRERRLPFRWRTAHPFRALAWLRADRPLRALAGLAFLSALAHESLPATFVLSTGARFGWDEYDTGLVLMGVGIMSALVSGGLVRPVVARLGERRALLVGLACGTASFFLYGFAPTGAVFLAAIPIGGLWSLAGPSMQSLMTRRVGPTEQGLLQGTLSSIKGFTGMIGPVLYTASLNAGTHATGNLRGAGAPFVLSALLLLACAGVAARVARRPEAG